MKYLILLVLFAAVSYADVSHIVNKDAEAPILKQVLDVGTDGTYEWSYETGNGIAAQEIGSLKNVGSEQEAQLAQGSAQWTAPDGTKVQFSYIADENGYQPQGDHIPTPPPIPEAIIRALKFIEENPPPVQN